MIPKNNTLNCLLTVALLVIIFQAGCTTTMPESILAPKIVVSEGISTAPTPTPTLSSVEPGTGLAEITDPDQIPDFRDDYDKITLLYAIDNSREYLKKVESYPDSFKSIGFTPERQIETLNLFRDGYVSSKSQQELSKFIADNFRIFQANGKENEGTIQYTGYGFAVFGDDVERKWKHTVRYGATGLPITPKRSMATGEGFFPPGGLAFAVIEAGESEAKSFFVLGHDTRSDINTAARADVFFGIGKDALKNAENFNTSGKLYYLLKR